MSRVDTKVDRALQEIGTKEALALRGRIAIGNSRLVYRKFKEVFGYRFDPLKERGAHLQKPLWASTSTKNPSYRDVLYVEELIGPDTVNTMPPATLHAFADHGQVRGATVMEGDPESDMKKLAELGINLSAITDELLKEGIEDFAKSFNNLLSALDRKRKLLLSGQFEMQSGWELGLHQDALEKRLDPRGVPYYWIGGNAPTGLVEDGTDFGAIKKGYISVTPLQMDMTDTVRLEKLNSIKL